MAADHGDVVAQALELKKIGNRLMTRRRRARDPPGQRARRRLVPGAAPRGADARSSRSSSGRARSRWRAVKLVAGFDFPDYERDYELVALRHPGEYPIDRGRIVSSARPRHRRRRVRRALRRGARARGRTPCTRPCASAARYLCGPLARFALNADELSPIAREAAREVGPRAGRAQPVPQHPRALRRARLRHRRGAAADRRLRAAGRAGARRVEPRAGTGHGCTEAPRGILYHRYTIDADGTIHGRRHHPADVAEPAHDRGRPARRGRALAGRARRASSRFCASRRSATTTRASRARPTS